MTELSNGTVSIIIPTYYRNKYLGEAIESALHQEYDPIEVIVVDDSGEAHAEPIATEYDEIEYVPLDRNRGANQARDAALEVATGEYVQFLDDDDLLRADKLRRQVPRLTESTGVVYSGLKYYDSSDVILPDSDVRGDVLEYTLRFQMWPPCFTTTMLIDRSVLETVRPLRHHGAGDTSFMIGLAQRTEFDFVDAPLVEKRRQGDNLGFSMQNVESKRRLLEEHEELYEQYPDSRSEAIAHVYRQEADVRLSKTLWSPLATVAYAKAAYYTRTARLEHVTAFLVSLLGRFPRQATYLIDRFLTIRRNEGTHQAFKSVEQYVRSR